MDCKLMRGKSILWLLAAISLGLSLGCARAPEERVSAGELFVLGREDLRERNFTKAREAFQKLLQEYPDSKLRAEALLNLADAYYKEEGYEESKFHYKKFVDLYPIHTKTPHALYYLGLSDYRRILSYDQDPQFARDALESFQKLKRSFPNHELVREAEERIRKLRRHLARHELYIARFYYGQGLYVSAIPRLREFLDEYEDVNEERDYALFILGESLMAEESYEKAGKAYGRLVKEFPGSSYARRARRRLSRIKALGQWTEK